MSIPKIIHFCWLSGDPYPDLVQRCIQSWKDKLPDYDFILWDKNRFDIHSVPWVEQACKVKKWAPASDYIRLYALYNYGGIYLDCDVEVLKSFDDLLNRTYFWGREHTPDKVELSGSIEAAVFGSEPGNKVIADCMEYFATHDYLDEKGVKNGMTLPTHFSMMIEKRKNENIEVFPMDYFSPKNTRTLKLTLTPHTYCIHHFDGSWHSPAQKKYVQLRKFFCTHVGESLGEWLTMVFVVPVNIYYEGVLYTLKRVLEKINLKLKHKDL